MPARGFDINAVVTDGMIADLTRIHCRQAAKWAAIMTLADTALDRPVREAAGLSLDDLVAECVRAADGDVGKAAGLAVSAARQLLANYERGGVDRGAHFAGRYDGAE